jgi:hypothetical protein
VGLQLLDWRLQVGNMRGRMREDEGERRWRELEISIRQMDLEHTAE